MDSREIIYLQRDTQAHMVPSGAMIMLHKDTEVSITQQMGDTFTVNVYGNLARIDAKDADALGKVIKSPLQDLPQDASVEDKIWVLLKQIYDPEIPVNIVDLGLIYSCQIAEPTVTITMTLTSPGCGMGPVIADDIKRMLLKLDELNEVAVDIVFDPPWSRTMISAAAQLELGVF